MKCRIIDADFYSGEIKLQVQDLDEMVVSSVEYVLEESVRSSHNFINWLANGERGVSSNTIATKITGIDCLGDSKGSPPHDGDDFRRCEQLLRDVPEFRQHLHLMSEVSGTWARLVGEWERLVEILDTDGCWDNLNTAIWKLRP